MALNAATEDVETWEGNVTDPICVYRGSKDEKHGTHVDLSRTGKGDKQINSPTHMISRKTKKHTYCKRDLLAKIVVRRGGKPSRGAVCVVCSRGPLKKKKPKT